MQFTLLLRKFLLEGLRVYFVTIIPRDDGIGAEELKYKRKPC